MASNPNARLQAALTETGVQLQMMSSRAQQLAADLFEANQLNQALSQQLTEEQTKNVGLSSKLEELQKGQ